MCYVYYIQVLWICNWIGKWIGPCGNCGKSLIFQGAVERWQAGYLKSRDDLASASFPWLRQFPQAGGALLLYFSTVKAIAFTTVHSERPLGSVFYRHFRSEIHVISFRDSRKSPLFRPQIHVNNVRRFTWKTHKVLASMCIAVTLRTQRWAKNHHRSV